MDSPIKGQSDSFLYKHIELSNGLQALVVHDPTAESVFFLWIFIHFRPVLHWMSMLDPFGTLQNIRDWPIFWNICCLWDQKNIQMKQNIEPLCLSTLALEMPIRTRRILFFSSRSMLTFSSRPLTGMSLL